MDILTGCVYREWFKDAEGQVPSRMRGSLASCSLNDRGTKSDER